MNLVAGYCATRRPMVAPQLLTVESDVSGLPHRLAFSPTIHTLQRLHIHVDDAEDVRGLGKLLAGPGSVLTCLDVQLNTMSNTGMNHARSRQSSSLFISFSVAPGPQRESAPPHLGLWHDALDAPKLARIVLSINRGCATRASKKLSTEPFDLMRPGFAGLTQVEV
jgi:hypothetical protein